MKVFWKSEELTPMEYRLLDAVTTAHAESAQRNNLSSAAVAASAAGSSDFTKAIAAALMTLGGIHGPVVQAYDLLGAREPLVCVGDCLEQGGKLPGWGNSFHCGEPDPLWAEVDELIAETPEGKTIAAITKAFHEHGKQIYPNPGIYTAAAARLLGMPREVAPYLFVAGRLNTWGQIFMNNLPEKPLWE